MKLVGKLPDHLTHRKLIICLRPHRLGWDTSSQNSNPPVADSTSLFSQGVETGIFGPSKRATMTASLLARPLAVRIQLGEPASFSG